MERLDHRRDVLGVAGERTDLGSLLDLLEQGAGAVAVMAQQVGVGDDSDDGAVALEREVVDPTAQQVDQRLGGGQRAVQGVDRAGHHLAHRGLRAAAGRQDAASQVAVGEDAHGVHGRGARDFALDEQDGADALAGHAPRGVADGGVDAERHRRARHQLADRHAEVAGERHRRAVGQRPQAFAEAGQEEGREGQLAREEAPHVVAVEAVEQAVLGGDRVEAGRVASGERGQAEDLAGADLVDQLSVELEPDRPLAHDPEVQVAPLAVEQPLADAGVDDFEVAPERRAPGLREVGEGRVLDEELERIQARLRPGPRRRPRAAAGSARARPIRRGRG